MSYLSPAVLALALFTPAFSNAEQVEASAAHHLRNSTLPERVPPRAARAVGAEFPCDGFAEYVATSGEYPRTTNLSLHGHRYSVSDRTDESPLKTRAGLFALEVTGSGWHVASLLNAEGMDNGELEGDGDFMFGAYLLISGQSAFMAVPTSGLPGDKDITVLSLNHPKADVVCVVRQNLKYSPSGILARFAGRRPWALPGEKLDDLWNVFGDQPSFSDVAGPYVPPKADTLNNAGPFYFSAQYLGSTARMRWELRIGEETDKVFRVDEPDLGQENECVSLAVYGPSADPAIICTGSHNVIRRYSYRSNSLGASRTLRLEETQIPVSSYRALSLRELKAWKAEKKRIRNSMR